MGPDGIHGTDETYETRRGPERGEYDYEYEYE